MDQHQPPVQQRLIRSSYGKVQWEQEFVNGRLDLYDPGTNTMYLAPGVATESVVANAAGVGLGAGVGFCTSSAGGCSRGAPR